MFNICSNNFVFFFSLPSLKLLQKAMREDEERNEIKWNQTTSYQPNENPILLTRVVRFTMYSVHAILSRYMWNKRTQQQNVMCMKNDEIYRGTERERAKMMKIQFAQQTCSTFIFCLLCALSLPCARCCCFFFILLFSSFFFHDFWCARTNVLPFEWLVLYYKLCRYDCSRQFESNVQYVPHVV